MTLLLCQMPSLRGLSFSYIELIDGTWEGVIELLSNSRQLNTVSILLGMGGLTHKNGHEFIYGTVNTDYTSEDFGYDLEKYILNGGRHPCLPQGCVNSAAHGYVMGLVAEENLAAYLRSCKNCGMKVLPDPGTVVPLKPSR